MAPFIYADFHNTDPAGRVRLNTVGTLEDMARHGVVLADGVRLTLYADDDDTEDGIRADAVVSRDPTEGWVAAIVWSDFRRTPVHAASNSATGGADE